MLDRSTLFLPNPVMWISSPFVFKT
jgi:hypothetical protein